jgi:serine/threonine protein kinase
LNKKDIVHRDIKPANILLNYDSSLKSQEGFIVKLADFTFAKSTTVVNAMAQTYCGTPLFMSPEMLLGNDVPNNKRNGDLWSVGVIFFQMLFRSLPYPCKNMLQLQQALLEFYLEIPSKPVISEESKHFLIGLLEKDPSRRFSFEELGSLITVTKEVERAEENHNKEYQKLEVDIKILQASLNALRAQNLESIAQQEEILAELTQIEQHNESLRKTNKDRESIINNFQTYVEEGLRALKIQ